MLGRKAGMLLLGYQKKESQVGQNLVECSGSMNDIEWKVLIACSRLEKRIFIEALFSIKLKPGLNTREEYRGPELTQIF